MGKDCTISFQHKVFCDVMISPQVYPPQTISSVNRLQADPGFLVSDTCGLHIKEQWQGAPETVCKPACLQSWEQLPFGIAFCHPSFWKMVWEAQAALSNKSLSFRLSQQFRHFAWGPSAQQRWGQGKNNVSPPGWGLYFLNAPEY